MPDSQFGEVRMRGFRQRAAVSDVLALLTARTAPLPSEPVPVLNATGRILAREVTSTVNVPGFAKSAMDGFAVHSSDTTGATSDTPRTLRIVGESLPARPFRGDVQSGEAVRIMTGAPIPSGTDAVLMAEFAHQEGNDRVIVRASVAAGKHVIRVGEDVARGDTVLQAGRKLRPQDIGLLVSIGVTSVQAVRQPRVAILVTGNELLPPGEMPAGFRIVDSNSPMLTALAARDGAVVLGVQRIPDDYTAVRDAIRATATDADVILVSGGTSVGTEDHAPLAAAELGELAVHGVALRPAGPLGVGFLSSSRSQSVPLFLIPGNPVSCLCAYDLFAGRVIRRLGRRSWELPYRKLTLPLAGEVASAVGRVDYVRVKVESTGVRPLATTGASNLSNAVAAAGFVLVPQECDHLAVGENVEVWLYDE